MRDLALAKKTAQRVSEFGHSITGCIPAHAQSLQTMRCIHADVFLVDSYMPYHDGKSVKKALQPDKCILVGTDIDRALQELEAYSVQRASKRSLQTVCEELYMLGFRPQNSATRQTAEALCIVLKDERRLADLKHLVYPLAAERCGVTWQSVERNIRYSIESVWTHGNLEKIQRLFGYTIDAERGKPTNKAFLAQLAEHIRISCA